MRRTKKKAARNCEEGGNVDWINDLPDCLICHILYFLPTKDAVATSVLSKRWMHLWTYVPNLDFDFTKFKGRRFRRQRKLERRNFIGPDGHAIPEQYEIKYSYLHYGSIIRNVISHNAVRLDNFRIAYILFDLSDYELEEFLRLAAARGVRNIEITSKYMDKGYFGNKIPESLLNFQHLVSLRLVRCYLDIQPSWSVCLSSLRDLSLEEIEYVDMECFELLIAGCPVLEELTLKQNCGHEYSWCIRSQTLKRLILELFFEEMRSSSFQFIFWGTNTPLLEFFSLQFHAVPDHLSRLPLKFLYNVPTVKWLKVACNFDDFDGGVSNRWGRRSPKRFLNLERLDFSIDWNFLFKLIALADNLKDLILRQVEGKMKLKFPSEVPKCLISHLERLTFVGFEFSDIEFSLLNYLLENALVLKKISMCCHLYKSSSSKLVEKLEGISDKIEVHVHRLDSPPPGWFVQMPCFPVMIDTLI